MPVGHGHIKHPKTLDLPFAACKEAYKNHALDDRFLDLPFAAYKEAYKNHALDDRFLDLPFAAYKEAYKNHALDDRFLDLLVTKVPGEYSIGDPFDEHKGKVDRDIERGHSEVCCITKEIENAKCGIPICRSWLLVKLRPAVC